MTDALAALIEQLAEDGEIDEDDVARIHAAAATEHATVKAEKAWRETAHVHDVPHRPTITRRPVADLAEADWPEEVDASDVICHDCRRELIADRDIARVLICPKLHSRRPGELKPGDPDGAVECGQPG